MWRLESFTAFGERYYDMSRKGSGTAVLGCLLSPFATSTAVTAERRFRAFVPETMPAVLSLFRVAGRAEGNDRRMPYVALLTLRAICSIHGSFGSGVMSAMASAWGSSKCRAAIKLRIHIR